MRIYYNGNNVEDSTFWFAQGYWFHMLPSFLSPDQSFFYSSFWTE